MWWVFGLGIAISIVAVCIPLRGEGRPDLFPPPERTKVTPRRQHQFYDQDG
jgi:hypothetical protein